MAELMQPDREYVIRGSGKKPRQVAIGIKSVRYEDDCGDWLGTSLDGIRCASGIESPYDLIPAPPPPKMVPLGLVDITVGVTLIGDNIGKDNEWAGLVMYRDNSGCRFVIGSHTDKHEYYDGLKKSGHVYSNDHGKTWQRCQKPEVQP